MANQQPNSNPQDAVKKLMEELDRRVRDALQTPQPSSDKKPNQS